MTDEKDNNAEIYSEIAAALDRLDGTPKEKILAVIADLMKRAGMVIDPDIRIAVKQILAAANAETNLSILKARMADALLRWLDKRGLVTLTKSEGMIDNVVLTKCGLGILSEGMIDAEVTTERDRGSPAPPRGGR